MQEDLGSETDGDSDEDLDSSGSDMDDEAAVAKARAFAAAVKSTGAPSGAPPSGDALSAAMAELDMDRYDDSDDDDLMARRLLGSGNPGMGYHRNPEGDPFLSRGGASDSDTDSEGEALRLRETDLLILAARNDEDVSHLEVWVYEEPDERGEGNLYVHHAVLLPAFPLALAWLDLDPAGRGTSGNFAAVGTFEPGIEIWDMDVLDAVEPVATLGGADYAAAREAMAAAAEDGKSKKKKKKKKGAGAAPQVPVRPGSHSDAVLGLSWNAEYRNVLASASADTTVKVWDVATGAASHTLSHHTSKVQAVAWNPAEAAALLSGGFDRRVCLADVRAAGEGGGGAAAAWDVPADVEALAWDPFNPTCFAASAESGEVLVFDARGGAGGAPLLRLGAHAKAASAVAYSPGVRGLLATASVDKRVKVWGWDAAAGGDPQALAGEDLKVGAIFGAGFSRDAPTVLAAGGAKGAVAVWDTVGAEPVEEWVKKQAAQ